MFYIIDVLFHRMSSKSLKIYPFFDKIMVNVAHNLMLFIKFEKKMNLGVPYEKEF